LIINVIGLFYSWYLKSVFPDSLTDNRDNCEIECSLFEGFLVKFIVFFLRCGFWFWTVLTVSFCFLFLISKGLFRFLVCNKGIIFYILLYEKIYYYLKRKSDGFDPGYRPVLKGGIWL
jgi:hypothetical protein